VLKLSEGKGRNTPFLFNPGLSVILRFSISGKYSLINGMAVFFTEIPAGKQ
jgi:hypothetical protein